MTTTDAPVRLAPFEIAPDTFVIQSTHQADGAPVAVHMNAMVIRGAEPVVVDTGTAIDRSTYLDDMFSLVEPDDVRWVFISHDDADHYGNLHEVMAACPQATLVASWFLCERLSTERLDIPPFRWRWVGDGESFEAGDRTLVAVRPPLYDSPTTRGLFDPSTGVYWASDCYATPVTAPTPAVSELDPGFWADGFTTFQTWNSPWVSLVDEGRFAAQCERVERLGVRAIATAHGPSITGGDVARAFEMTRAMPSAVAPPQPGQPVLDQLIHSILSA